ncbi:hypothetical protein BV22DRAFT_1040711 [Leucogyrophana mollusca]|uniref:Uncharacterized protein n=1 Tax=Leucogyrophana mollusca TaxID=85980 RepID=A0ACB8B2I7_9AGAM|nr:hypothetical protein BV22DRAFT_1040711 [Leucogyrophana mollusca]
MSLKHTFGISARCFEYADMYYSSRCEIMRNMGAGCPCHNGGSPICMHNGTIMLILVFSPTYDTL